MVGYGAAACWCSPWSSWSVVVAARRRRRRRGERGPSVLPERRLGARAEGVRPDKGRGQAAGCELKAVKASGSFDHTTDPNERVKYNSNPPTSGGTSSVPADDGAYSTAPTDEQLVHNLEHGRVIIWFKPSLPKDDASGPQGAVRRGHLPDAARAADQDALPGGRERVERDARTERAGAAAHCDARDRDLGRAPRVPRREPLERPRGRSPSRGAAARRSRCLQLRPLPARHRPARNRAPDTVFRDA